MDGKDVGKAVKNRASTIRTRTWSLTIFLVICLGFYFLVTAVTKQTINWIDFVFLCFIQITTHCLYFPDGEVFGQKDATFRANRTAYNEKATDVNTKRKAGRLRRYCDYDYEERKSRYIETKCGKIGISIEELEILKKEPEEKLKNITSFEYGEGENTKILFFSKSKRKILLHLIFDPIPVEKNHTETILSAVENDGTRAITDGSVSFKIWVYIRRVFVSVVIGGILAYIGYTAKDGIGLDEIVSVIIYVASMFSTAVMSFSLGETCQKVHKSRFYIELANFLDGFFEWDKDNYIDNSQDLIIGKSVE